MRDTRGSDDRHRAPTCVELATSSARGTGNFDDAEISRNVQHNTPATSTTHAVCMARRRPVESRTYALRVLGLLEHELRPVCVHDVWIERGGVLLAASKR